MADAALDRVVDMSRYRQGITRPQGFSALATRDSTNPSKRSPKALPAAGPMLEGDQCHVCRLKGRRKASSSYCMTCDMQMCKSCTDQHRTTRVTAEHQIVSKKRAMNVPTCAIHRFAPIKYYCDTCGDFVCVNCTMIDHKGHAVEDIRDKVRSSRRFLQTAVDTLDGKLLNINTEIKKIQDLEINIEQARRKMKVKVNEQVNQLAQQLKTQHEKMTSTMDTHFDDYLDDLTHRKETMKSDYDGINGLRRTVEHDLSIGKDDKLVVDAMKLENEVKAAIAVNVRPVEITDFRALEFVLTNNAVLGNIEVTNEPVVNAHKFFIEAGDRGHIINKLWTRLKIVYRYKTTAYLKEPSGIAVMPTGRYVVTDYANHGLLICDKTGRFQQRVLLLEVARPAGVGITRQGDIAVTSDRWVKTFKGAGLLNQVGQFSIYPSPGSFTIDDQGRYIINDLRTKQICIYDDDGKLVSKFDSTDKGGSAPDMFNMSVHGGHIALAYQYGSNHYVRVFGYDGAILHSTKIPQPCTGLFIDRIGNMLVATTDNVFIIPAGGRVMQPLIVLDKNNRAFKLNPRLIGLTPEGNILSVHQHPTGNRSEIVLLQPIVAENRLANY